MRRNLQPQVELGQQLIVGSGRRTLQLMVVMSHEEARKGFAERFNQALDVTDGCPPAIEQGGRGRAAWVSREFRISSEGAAKWLDGRVMPSQTNMARIATHLKIDPCWLWSGQGKMRPDLPLELVQLWPDIDDLGQTNVILAVKQWHAARPRGKANAGPDDEPR